MRLVPVPLARVALGQKLPVDIRAADGRLLLRRGHVLQSEAHRDMLAAHQASMTETDASAWHKAHARQMFFLQQSGADVFTLATATLPAEILDTDYLEGRAVAGGWLDLQEILRGLLYQGSQASSPLPRLQGIEHKALQLLAADPEDSLFTLFQALPDLGLGYCATHALLSGVVGALAASKMDLPPERRALLMRSAMVMNIGMARPQDSLARQHLPPTGAQRQLIGAHPPHSADILRGFGVQDPEWVDLVQWHHTPDAVATHSQQQLSLQLIHLADTLVAKMAPRTSRAAMSPLGAAKALVLEANAQTHAQRVATVSVLGFYPPGTYVQLASGEVGVVMVRGDRATTPHVASLINAKGMPLSSYMYRDTAQPDWAVRAPVAANKVNVSVNAEKVRRLRQHHGL